DEAVFGDEAHRNAARADGAGAEPHDALALVIDAARFDLPQPRDRLAQFALSAARDARNAQNFAAADEEVQIFDGVAPFVAVDGEIPDLKQGPFGMRFGAGDVESHLLAHHHL